MPNVGIGVLILVIARTKALPRFWGQVLIFQRFNSNGRTELLEPKLL